MQIDSRKWYTALEAKRFLEVTEPTVKGYFKKGVLRGKQFGPKKKWHVKGVEIKRLRVKWGLDIIQHRKNPKRSRSHKSRTND